MSVTALCMRRDGYTWAEIAEHLQLASPAAAHASATAAAQVIYGDAGRPPTSRSDRDA